MEGITRRAGKPHVTSTQHRLIYERLIGPDSYILSANENMEPTLQSNNVLRIGSGMLCHHGFISEIKKNTYDEVTINNGTQGMKRIDLVVARHSRNAETEVETSEWVVIQGTPAASSPATPTYTEGDINDGDLIDDCPVFKVELDGIQVTSVTKLLTVLDGSLSELNSKINDPLIIKQRFSKNVTVSANGTKNMTMGGISVPDGYELWGIIPVLSGYGDNWQVTFGKYGGNVVAYIKSWFAQSLTHEISCNAIYVKK